MPAIFIACIDYPQYSPIVCLRQKQGGQIRKEINIRVVKVNAVFNFYEDYEFIQQKF